MRSSSSRRLRTVWWISVILSATTSARPVASTSAAPTELDHVWYDDIRVYHCAGPVDAGTGTSPDPLCATDTLLPTFPSP